MLHLAGSVAPALGTRVADHLARSMAGAAGAPDGKEALLIEDLAAAVAGGAGARVAARFGARSAASAAGFHARNLDFRGQAEHGFLEADFEIVADVFASLRAAAAAPATAAKQVSKAEKVAQDVTEIAESLGIETARSASALQPGVAV